MEKTQQILHIRICRGLELPKTELLSEIDPWVKLLTPEQLDDEDLDPSSAAPVATEQACLQTRKIDNDANPNWEENFCIPLWCSEDGHLQGSVRFELWAKGVFGDQFCGHAILDLWSVPFGKNTAEMQLALEYADDKASKFGKQGRNSRLVVKFLGSILSGQEMAEYLGPSSFHTPDFKDVYMLLDRGRGLYCGVHYAPRQVSFSICVCKSQSNNHVDVAYYGEDLEEAYVIARRIHQNGKKIFPGVTCFEEVLIMGLPLYIDFSNLLLSVEERKAKEYIHVDELLHQAEWPGPGADLNKAAQVMEAAHTGMTFVDEDAVYVKCSRTDSSSTASSSDRTTERSAPSKSTRVYAMLKLDYLGPAATSGPGGMVQWISGGSGRGLRGLYLCIARPKHGITWEWMNPDVDMMETLSLVPSEPENILGGKHSVVRKVKVVTSDSTEPKAALQLQLDSFIVRYSVKNYMDWSVFEILDPRGEWVDEDDDTNSDEDEMELMAHGAQAGKQLVDSAASLSGNVVRGIGAGAGKMASEAGRIAAGGASKLTGAVSMGVGALTTGVRSIGMGVGSAVGMKPDKAREGGADESGKVLNRQRSHGRRKPCLASGDGVELSFPSKTHRPVSKSRWQPQAGALEEEEDDEDSRQQISTSKKVSSTHNIALEARDKLAERTEKIHRIDEKAATLESQAQEFAALAKAKREKASKSFF